MAQTLEVRIVRRSAPNKNQAAKTKWQEQTNQVKTSFPYSPSIVKDQNAVLLLTGEFEGQNLVVVDVDLKDPTPQGFAYIHRAIKEYIGKTTLVRTMHGGLHIYTLQKEEIRNTSFLEAEDCPGIEIDRRGEGGFVYGPYSWFMEQDLHVIESGPDLQYSRNKPFRYEPYGNLDQHLIRKDYLLLNPLMKPTYIDIDTIHSFLGAIRPSGEEKEPKKRMSHPRSLKLPDKINFEHVPIIENAFTIYPRILDGRYQIKHHGQAGLKEFLIWSQLWQWVIANKMDENKVKTQLAENQPAFKQTETDDQLRCLKANLQKHPDLFPSKRIASILLYDYATNHNRRVLK